MRGIITRAVGGFFFPADDEQNIYRTKIRGRIQDKLYPGDNVEFNEKMVEKLLPRKNLLSRPKIANVDYVIIVFSVLYPEFDRTLLDRFLVLVENHNLKPLIVVNKTDLLKAHELLKFKKALEDYNEAGYKVFMLSAETHHGIENFKKHIKGVTVLAGPSGVGKSSIINKLVDKVDLKVGEVSKKLKRGKHTTKHVRLLPVDKKGWIADTPGFSSLEISDITLQRLPFNFPELDQFLDKCRFTGCSHTHEPDCAVKKAVTCSQLSKKRYKSYKMFYDEISSN